MTSKKKQTDDVKIEYLLELEINTSANKRKIYLEAAIDFPQNSEIANNQITLHTINFKLARRFTNPKLLLFKTKQKWRGMMR